MGKPGATGASRFNYRKLTLCRRKLKKLRRVISGWITVLTYDHEVVIAIPSAVLGIGRQAVCLDALTVHNLSRHGAALDLTVT
jgi:hypothetical protein